MASTLEGLIRRFGITVATPCDFRLLHGYRIIIIADDSNSMKKPAAGVNSPDLDLKIRSRWHDLRQTVEDIVDIASSVDGRSVDILFLNRPPILDVTSSKEAAVRTNFEEAPKGGRPLANTLAKAVARPAAGGAETNALILILTGGEPSEGTAEFTDVLEDAIFGGNVKVQLVACTPEYVERRWLNAFDNKYRSVGVVYHFAAEREEALEAGITSKFTRGDWYIKALLGTVNSKFENWDDGIIIDESGKGHIKPDVSCPLGCGKQQCVLM